MPGFVTNHSQRLGSRLEDKVCHVYFLYTHSSRRKYMAFSSCLVHGFITHFGELSIQCKPCDGGGYADDLGDSE